MSDPRDVARPEPVQSLNWDAQRAKAFGDRILALWQEFLTRLPELPVAKHDDAGMVRHGVVMQVPDEPLGEEAIVEHLRSLAFDYATYPGHPRFMAYITGPGTVPGAAADLLAAGLNMNLGAWRLSPGPTEIERALIRFFAEAFGLPSTAGGVLVSGGAMANFTALKAARDHQLGLDVRRDGVAAHGPVGVYASSEIHVTTDRALDMLGLGSGALRKVDVDDAWRIRLDMLQAAIDADREQGVRPAIVVATAGTVATGAIDPLAGIADLCEREGLWMHVDGAYGGPAVLAEDLRPGFAGIERADSLAFDPHKWMYTPHSGGCVLVRDEARLEASFAAHASYIREDTERMDHEVDLGHLSPQFSRGFQALKIWVSLLAHGRRAYGERISHDAALARYLAASVDAHPLFELAAPVTLSICCFRFVPENLPGSDGDPAARERYLSELNERIMTELQLDGRVYISNAVLGDAFVLRACVVNFRTEAADMDAVLDVAAELGARLDAELRPSAFASLD
ncbi:MAG TPA: aminotransferase class V-fold PLP-dependent enzyme [Actinomycetota bacterium]|nr:aminotransferase class V-fold PLP-dependent enzyme [Actinomycetota bacterium]